MLSKFFRTSLSKDPEKDATFMLFFQLQFAGQVSLLQLHEEILYNFQAHGQTRLRSAHQESQHDVQISPKEPSSCSQFLISQ